MYEQSGRVKNSTWRGVRKTLSLLLTVAMVFGVVPTPWTDAKVVKAEPTTKYLYKVGDTAPKSVDTAPSNVAEEGTILKWTYDDGEGKTLTLDTVSASGGTEGTAASVPEDYKNGEDTPAYPWADNAGDILAVEVKSADAVTSAENIKTALTALTKLKKVTKAADADTTIKLPEVTNKAWVTGSEASYTIVEEISGAAEAEANLAYLLTNMTASDSTVDLAPAGKKTVTMTLTATGATVGEDIILDETISAVSSDDDVASVTVGEGEDKNKVTIAGGSKLGTATITVSSTEPGTKIEPVNITVTVATEGDILGSVEKTDYAADAKILHWALNKDGKLTLSAVDNTNGKDTDGTEYDIKSFGSDKMPWADYAAQIKTAEIDASIGSSTLESMAGLFKGLSELTTITIGAGSTGNIADMTDMFEGCSKLAAIDLTNLLGKSDITADKLYDLSGCSALAEVKVPTTFGKSIAIPNAADNKIWAASDDTVEAKVTITESKTTTVDDTVKGKTVKLKYLPEIAIAVAGDKATLSDDKIEVSLKQNDDNGAAVTASLAETIKVGEDTIASDDIYKPAASEEGYTYAVTTKNGEEDYKSITVTPNTNIATNGKFAVKPGAKANLDGETVTISYKKGEAVLATYDLKAIVEKDAEFNVFIDFYNEAENGKRYSSEAIEVSYAESGSQEVPLNASAIKEFKDKEGNTFTDGLHFAYKVTGLDNEKTGAFYPINADDKVLIPKDILDVNGEVRLTLAVAIKDYTLQYMASAGATEPLKTVKVTAVESDITVDGDSLLGESLQKGKTITAWKATKGSDELAFTPGTKFSEKIAIDVDGIKIANVDKVVKDGVIKLVPTLGDYKYKIHFLDAETGKIPVGADEEFVYSESTPHSIGTAVPTEGTNVNGYTLDGWYDTKEIAEGTEKITAVPADTARDFTVYAKRTKKEVKVAYDVNGASISKATDTEKTALAAITIEEGTLTVGDKVNDGASLTEKAPKGYKFVGWKEDSGVTVYTSADAVTGEQIETLYAVDSTNHKVTLKAQWEPIEYSITYNYGTLYPEEYSVAEGKEGANKYTIETASSGFKLQDPTLRGYTLTKWALDGEKKTEATLEKLQELCQNVTLYCDFAEKELTLTIGTHKPEDSPYEIETNDEKTTTIKVKANQKNPFKEIYEYGYSLKGYYFVGWTIQTGEFERYADDFEAPLNGDEIATIEEAIEDGTIFLHAIWEPIRLDVNYSKDTNTIAENLKAGVKNINRTSFYPNSCGTKIELKNPTRGGYKFKNWVDCSENTEGDKASILISSNGKTYISRDKLVDLIDQDGYPCIGAEWEKVGTVIKFNANVPEGTKITSGNVPADITVASNNTRAVTLTRNAAKINNYKFLGWSSSPYSSTMSYKDGAKIDDNLCSDYSGFNEDGDQVVNLYAVWQPISYSITYKNAELGKQGVTKNDNVTTFKGYVTDGIIELTKPERPGFTFTGWYSKSSCKPADELYKKDANTWCLNVGSVTTVYKKQTVYAGWVGKSVTITFDSGVNKIQRNVTIKDTYNKKNTQVLKYNGKPIALTASKYKVTSPTNFTFAGWSLEAPVKYEFADGSREIDFVDKEKVDGEFIEQFDGESITLYGVWEPKPFKITVYEKFGSAAAKKNTFYYNDLKFNAFDTAVTSNNNKLAIYNENNEFYEVEFANYDGYYIDGIYTKAGCTVKDSLGYIDTSIKKNQKALNIYIKYTPIEYTIKYTTDGMTGITGTIIDQKNPFGKNVMLRKNQFKKSSKKFLGWSTQKDKEGFESVEFKANRLIKFDDLLYTAKNNGQDIDIEKKAGGQYDIKLYPVFSE